MKFARKLSHGRPVLPCYEPVKPYIRAWFSPQAARNEMRWGTERKKQTKKEREKQRNSVKIKRPCFALA